MITICNRLIPFGGYQAMAFWPFVFTRSSLMSARRKNHESIYLRQQLEVLIAAAVVLAAVILLAGWSWWWLLTAAAVYYAGYGIDYAVRRILYRSHLEAYRNIAAEQEAYLNEQDAAYLANRRPFAWIRYIGRRTYKRQTR